MNGRQLVEQALRRRPELQVLFTTGYARNALVHNGRLDPGVELIVNPFTDAALGPAVDAGLGKDLAQRGRCKPRGDERLMQINARSTASDH
jgi:hypothetical protein